MRVGIFVTGTWIALAGLGGVAWAQPKNPAPAAATPKGADPKSPPAAAAAPEITVTNLGKEEGRRELRLKPVAGTSTTFAMTTSQTTDVTMESGQTMKSPVPGTTMTLTCTVDKVDANGDFQTTSTITDVKLSPAEGMDESLLEATKAAYERVRGMKIVLRTTNRGFSTAVSSDMPSGDPAMKQMIDGMTQSMAQSGIPLPQEAVGLGAIWKSKTKVSMLGCEIETVAQYTVKELTPTTAVLDVVVNQTAKDQEMNFPGMPAGAMKVKSMTGEGKGTMTTAADMGMATKFGLSTTATMNMEVSMQETKMSMKSVSTVVMTLEVVPAKPEATPPAKK